MTSDVKQMFPCPSLLIVRICIPFSLKIHDCDMLPGCADDDPITPDPCLATQTTWPAAGGSAR